MQKIHNEPNAVSGQRKTPKRHSKSETIFKTISSEPRGKSESMKLPEAEARRVTRSSFGSFPDSSLKKKIQKPVQNRDTGKRNTEKSAATRTESNKLTTLRRSLEKPVTVKLAEIEKKQVVTKESKRVTRSSYGSVTGLCPLRNRNPKSNPVTEHVLNVQNLIKSKSNSQKNKQVISKDSKRMTRSSLGSEIGSISSRIRSAEKHIKSKRIVEKMDSMVTSNVSKKVTRSSLGSLTSSTSMKNKNSQNKLSVSPQVQSSGRQSKLKKTIEEKEPISTDDPKRTKRSSLANATTTSISSRNKSPVVKNVAPPLQKQEKRAKTKNMTKDKNPENVVKHTKRLTRSSLGDASITSLVVEETPECMVVESPLFLSVPKTKQKNLSDRSDEVVKKTKKTDKKDIQNDSKQKKLSDKSDEVVKKTKESDKSTNTRKKTLSSTIESTPVPSTSGTRRKISLLQTGSLSGSHSYKNLSKSFKNYIETELKDIPIDCLTNESLCCPQQAVAKNSYKNINSPLIRSKNTGEHNLNG